MSDDLYPLFGYDFDSKGRYSAPTRIENEADLRLYFLTTAKKALDEKREVRITDTGDLLCFHIKGGKILFDGVNHF